jgi:hypothetical protein
MARLDPELFPDRFELDRYARRMRDQEFGRLIRAVADGVRRWARHLSYAAPSAHPAARGLGAN